MKKKKIIIIHTNIHTYIHTCTYTKASHKETESFLIVAGSGPSAILGMSCLETVLNNAGKGAKHNGKTVDKRL